LTIETALLLAVVAVCLATLKKVYDLEKKMKEARMQFIEEIHLTAKDVEEIVRAIKRALKEDEKK